ncbi:MAG: tetratricopeptide repeat protein [bacterium]
MNKENLLHNYFKNTLSEEEKAQLFELLEKDADFKESFDEYNDLNLAFKKQEANELKDYLQNLENAQVNRQWYQQSWIRYAAAAILVIAIGLQFLLGDTTSLYDQYYETYPNVELPVVRNSEQDAAMKAFQAYENKAYQKSISEFEALLKDSENLNYRFYYAMAFLNNQQYDEALAQLNLLEKQTFDYSEETQWYQALILLQQKNTEQALSKLNDLENQNSSFNKTERKELIKKLSK